jgi:hypothetical protein
MNMYDLDPDDELDEAEELEARQDEQDDTEPLTAPAGISCSAMQEFAQQHPGRLITCRRPMAFAWAARPEIET